MKCSSCGAELREGAVFCPKCGNKIFTENKKAGAISSNINKTSNLGMIIMVVIVCLCAMIAIVCLFFNKAKTSKTGDSVDDNNLIEASRVDELPQVENNEIDDVVIEEAVENNEIIYSESYYLNNTAGLIDQLSKYDNDADRLELLKKYCITERSNLIDADDSLYYKSGDYPIDEIPFIYYGDRFDYVYEDGTLVGKHKYYKDALYIMERQDLPLRLNYVPSYDYTEKVKEGISIDFINLDATSNTVVLGNTSENHFDNELYCDCAYELNSNGYTIDDVEIVYEDCDITEYMTDEYWDQQEKSWTEQGISADIIRWDEYETTANVLKMKDGNWLISWLQGAGGGNSIDIFDDDKRLVASISEDVQTTMGSIVFYFYEDNTNDTDYTINPLYFDFIYGKTPAKSTEGTSYYIYENPRTHVYLEDAQSGISFIDLDNDGEFEMFVADFEAETSGTIFDVVDGELIEWMSGGPITNGPLGCDLHWVKYDDAAWIYSTAERYAWGICMEKYSGTDIVDSFEIIDKILEDGETHMYSYRDQIVSEEEFKNIYKGIFKHEYWGY